MKSLFKGSLMFMSLMIFIKYIIATSVVCGIAWLIGIIFDVSVNYSIPVIIVTTIYALISVLFVIQGVMVKRVANEIDKEFDTDFFKSFK